MQLRKRIFHQLIYFRLFLLSLVGALVLSLVSLYTMLRVTDLAVKDYRYGYLQYIARKIEKLSVEKSLSQIKLHELASYAEESYPLIDVTERKDFSRPRGETQPKLWILSAAGKILSTNYEPKLPLSLSEIPFPHKVHEVTSTEKGFFKPQTFVIKLDTVPSSYLLSHNAGLFFQGPLLWVQGAHTFVTASLAMFLALGICVFYLRRKSRDAREVLLRMEAGDLRARFQIKRFDECGSLLLDFNRMAERIESLVKKVNDAESARSHLLQELGHDVRTPLTSLNTSFETLREHHENLSREDRDELYNMLSADIRYFSDLLEKLTMIASINVPQYKATTEVIDLSSLLEEELQSRQAYSKNYLRWEFKINQENPFTIVGDPHLITRLFRNAFDNASRFANHVIEVSLLSTLEGIAVIVTDDGPGVTDEAIESFGKRRERRKVKDRDSENFSLGLGSVIMKTIAEVHNGVVIIGNADQTSTLSGASVKVLFRPR